MRLPSIIASASLRALSSLKPFVSMSFLNLGRSLSATNSSASSTNTQGMVALLIEKFLASEKSSRHSWW